MPEKLIDEPVPVVATKREDTLPKSVEATTPGPNPNVQIVAMPWWQIVLVRTARVYLQALVGFVIAGGTGLAAAVDVRMPVQEFGSLIVASASLAVAPATITLLQNAAELLAKLDVNRPSLRA